MLTCFVRQDVLQILDDLSLAYVFHEDFRPANLVHAPKNTKKCKHHKRIHKWNIIDLATVPVDEYSENDDDKFKTLSRLQRRGYHCNYFYTGSHISIHDYTPKLSVYPTEAPPEIIDMVRFRHPTNPSADNPCANMIFSYQMPATPSSIGSGNISSTRHHTVHRADTGGGRLLQGELESEHLMTILPFTCVTICIYAVLGSCRFKWHTNLHCSDVVTTLCRFLPERKTDILQ